MTEKGFMKKLTIKTKEFFRRQFVVLKKHPQNVSLLVLVIALLVYSLNMTFISNTTAYLQTRGMGLCSFVSYLISILMFVTFFSTFQKRKKASLVKIILLIALLALIIFCDIVYYRGTITPFIGEGARDFSKVNEPYYSSILNARKTVLAHIILLAFVAVLILTLPFYKKLFAKINTSVAVEDIAMSTAIEISDED